MERIDDLVRRLHPGISGAALPSGYDCQIQNEQAREKLRSLGYRWSGTAWTDEPTEEQRLEAIKALIDSRSHIGTLAGIPVMSNDGIKALQAILSPTWRPGKTEGK